MKRWLLIALPILLLIILIVKISLAPDDVLSRLEDNEKKVREELTLIDEEINEYYQSKNKKRPEYLFLTKENNKKILKLIEDRFYQEVRLSDIYEQFGDYYLDEQYLFKSSRNNQYRQFFSSLPYDKLNPEKLEMYWTKKEKAARDIFETLIETRLIALEYYKKSEKHLFDKSSDFFKLKKDTKHNKISPFILLVSKDPLSQKLKPDKDGKSYLADYFHQRVKPSLHRKKGQVYYQITKFTNYLGVKENDNPPLQIKTLVNQLKIKESIKIEENIKTPQYYARLCEKEFHLSLLADDYIRRKRKSKVNEKIDDRFSNLTQIGNYVPAIYELSEHYVYRYEKLDDFQKVFYLTKAEFYLKKLTYPEIKDSDQRKDFLKNLDKYKLKSLMLLARIYYHYSNLSQKNIDLIRKQKLNFNFGGSFLNRKDIQKYYLREFINLYDNRIIAYISESHKNYKTIHDTRSRVKNELDILNQP